MRLRYHVTDFASWDGVARVIIQDPYDPEHQPEWAQLNQWMLKILNGLLRKRVTPLMPLEDVQQNATEALIEALETYDPRKDDKPTRHILAQIRYRVNLQDYQARQKPVVPVDPKAPVLANIQTGLNAPSMEDQITDRMVLEQALWQLRPSERTIIQCTFFHDWADDQIHETFGWSKAKIYQDRSRALRKLEGVLGPTYQRGPKA